MKYKVNISYVVDDEMLRDQGLKNIEEYIDAACRKYIDVAGRKHILYDKSQITYEKVLTFKDIEFYEKNDINKITFLLSEMEELVLDATIINVNKEQETLDITFNYGLKLYTTITLDRVLSCSLEKIDPLELNLIRNDLPFNESCNYYHFEDEPPTIKKDFLQQNPQQNFLQQNPQQNFKR